MSLLGSIRVQPFAIDHCTVNFQVDDDCEHPGALKNIDVEVRHPEHGQIALLSSLKIDRSKCFGQFLQIMDDHSQELHEFSVKLFNKYGKLKPDHVDHEYHKGSGCWGRELDDGMLIYVVDVEVNPSFRNKGVGSLMLKKLLESPYVGEHDYIIAWPALTESIKDRKVWNAKKAELVNFFRKNNFRRIGRTEFFACAKDPEHPSRHLAASQDAEGHLQLADIDPDRGVRVMEMLPGGQFNMRYERPPGLPPHEVEFAVHHAIADDKRKHIDIAAKIRDAYAADPTSVRKRDEDGVTPLYLAAGLMDLGAVRALLSLPPESGIIEDLTRRDNADGMTPLEVCERQMVSTREFSETMLGVWGGYDDDSLRVTVLLKRAAGEDIPVTDDEYVKARKYGCTCGQCTGGWLSPRMRYRLMTEASVYSDVMGDSEPVFIPGQPLTLDQIISTVALDHLPPLLWDIINRTFFNEYRLVIHTIAEVLDKPGDAGIPTPDNYALDYVTHLAKEQSPFGDNEWDSQQEETNPDGSPFDPLYTAMPVCANDLEFDTVRKKLGLSPEEQWGPYDDLATYDEEDEDM
ncbi:hypothetical protein A0H81_02167 [Grifola frondosa]|uniref:N-acetyltransferase domain-containing protein n=1 Tax=Grifola frondosa TaxID=5627 RepID=A0A1C7MNN1_GRIFR|nr:hypothetical protein A0H81_02167 [Grifola frondosa]